MDKLTTINVFLAVAETGNFSAVADKMGLSRPMVTRHIAEMESWLNTRLFHRTTRHVTLTESGKQAVEFCRDIANSVQAMQNELAAQSGELRGTLRLAASVSFGSTHLTAAINRFLAQHPKLHIQLDLSEKSVNLVEDRIDLALRICKEPDELKIARKLSPCRSVLVAHPDYLAAHGTPLEPQDLAAHACLSHSHFNHSEWVFYGKDGEQRHRFQNRFSSNDAVSLLSAVSVGAGIAMLPRFLTNDYVASGKLQEVLTDWQLPELSIYAMYSSRQNQPIAVRQLLDFLIDEFQGRDW